jgi:uncharacterized protein (DUF2237 family)
MPVSTENSSSILLILYCTAEPLRGNEGGCCACERTDGGTGVVCVCVAIEERRRKRLLE